MDIDQFLRESVFYPCSGLDGTPVNYLSNKGFSNFLYADYSVTRESLNNKCLNGWFLGYRQSRIEYLSPDLVLGASWKAISENYEETISKIHFEWTDPFIALVHFEKLAEFSKEQNPQTIKLMFIRCEAIAAFDSIFHRRGISPKCLTYIRSGIGFGGNFSEFPHKLDYAIRMNPAGLPEFILYDKLATSGGDYMSLVKEYKLSAEEWDYPTDGYGDGHITFAQYGGNSGQLFSPIRPTVD